MKKTIRGLLPIAVPILVVGAYFYYQLRLPSPEEEAARLKDVSRITLMRVDETNLGTGVSVEVSIDSPEEIEHFISTLHFGPKAEDCRCYYTRKLRFSTPDGEVEYVLGPHHFKVIHRRTQENVFQTPPEFFAAFESYYVGEPETLKVGNEAKESQGLPHQEFE